MSKIRAYQDLTNQPKSKLINYLHSGNNCSALIISDHGLGDVVEFLSLFEMTQKRYPNWDLYFGYHPSLDFKLLHPKSYPITELNKEYTLPIGRSIVQMPNVLQRYDLDKLSEKFDYIFAIQMYDYKHPINPHTKIPNPKPKLEMCKVLEFGYPEETPIEKYRLNINLNNSDNKYIAFHCDGNTDKMIKTPTLQEQELIWNEIKDAGFTPIDIHLNSRVTISNSIKNLPPFMKEEESIRDSGGGLELLLNTISKCVGIVGILSGPLHLSNCILEENKCIGLQKGFTISNYILNSKMNVLDINKGYEKGSVYNILKGFKNE